MRLRYFISMGIFLIFMMIPVTVFAVDFEVTDVKIDVYLTEDGHADVIETHTYDFDSKFNGITREVFPKTGSSIIHFEAYESDKPLKVEQENQFYKIHRSGSKEKLTVDLYYTITDTVEKYEDGTQFYLSFFSKRNEVDYENMTITVYPPNQASEVDFLGYHAAYGSGEVGADGIVTFGLGAVESGTDGDVRVIYESSLFPHVPALMSGAIREELRAEGEEMQAKEATFLKTKGSLQSSAKYAATGALLALVGLYTYLIGKGRKLKSVAEFTIDDAFVPRAKLSLPGTIQYMKPLGNGPEMISAALLDLIRQQYVKQVTETSFELLTNEGANVHETALIDLLFFKIGDGKTFTFEQLEVYTKDSSNHGSYGLALAAWRKGIRDEVKGAQLYETKAKLRVTIGLISLALTPFIFVFGYYELYWFMGLFIFICLIGMLTAAIYSPRSIEGFTMKEEWTRLQNRMKGLDLEEWDKLPIDDKYRAYIYGIGMKDARLEEMYDEFERASTRTAQQANMSSSFYPIPYNPAYTASHFQAADQNALVSSDGSGSSGSGSSGGGGGVGGSGGGSGAF